MNFGKYLIRCDNYASYYTWSVLPTKEEISGLLFSNVLKISNTVTAF
jgi:hypothetical protein